MSVYDIIWSMEGDYVADNFKKKISYYDSFSAIISF